MVGSFITGRGSTYFMNDCDNIRQTLVLMYESCSIVYKKQIILVLLYRFQHEGNRMSTAAHEGEQRGRESLSNGRQV